MSAKLLLPAAAALLWGTHSLAAADDTWYYDNWCETNSNLQYLLDSECAKVFPSSFGRDWRCPIALRPEDPIPEGYSADAPLNLVHVDTSTLPAYVTAQADICIVSIKRRVSPEGEAQVFSKYYCNGERSVNVAFEPWSSSKIFAAANAAGHLRAEEPSCTPGTVGLDGSTTGEHGATPLGDLATVICSYDSTAGYSSNALASYMHDVGWRERLHSLVTDPTWLGCGAEGAKLAAVSLGGNYGATTPTDLGFDVADAAGGYSCPAERDPWPEVFPNSLTALAAAELTRRLVLHDEISASLRFPGMQSEDARSILVGANTSLLFPGLRWGGMAADPAIFMQSSVNISAVEEASGGQWRIFSKLGDGFIDNVDHAEVVNNAYACFPGAAGGADGHEFVVSARASIPDDGSLQKAEGQVLQAFQQAVQALMTGEMQ